MYGAIRLYRGIFYAQRSTDKLCLESLSELTFEKPSSYDTEEHEYNNGLSIEVEPSAKWQMEFSGWIDQSDFSIDSPTSTNILPIAVTKLESRDEAIGRFGNHGAELI